VTRRASPRLAAYGLLGALALVGALAARRPELVAIAAPFALVLALATLVDRSPRLSARFVLDRERALEGEVLDATLVLRSADPVSRVEAYAVLPPSFEVADDALPVSLHLAPDEHVDVPVRLLCPQWGSFAVGDVRVRASDPLALFAWEERFAGTQRLRIYPRPETLRRLVPPLSTQAAVGSEVARVKGDGLEFADLRPFVPGDRVRSVNWRASARRADLVVNERHPERNTDVVVFLDTFVDARRLDAGILDRAVRATSTLATHYLERRDRVGLVALGGTLRWLQPGSGLVQRYRLVDALLETEVVFTYAWKDASVIPSRTLPPRALVVGVTPLLDARGMAALLDLRGRGRDVAVLEVSPLDIVEPGLSEDDRLAYRLWRLQREELVSRFTRLGVAVGRWRGDESLAPRIEEVTAFRRHAAPVRR
jgi:uncharacterized protein (DUF58 family)